MKITKTQLRKIIREEYENLPQAGDPEEFARLKAQRDSARIPDAKADVRIPADLFEELLEYLEDMAGFRMKGGGFVRSRGEALLVKVQKEAGIK